MVIIGLVVAGVAITLDKQKKRQAAKAQLESENQALISAEALRNQREIDAFNELQNYADFQDYLSTKVMDDIDTESPPHYETSSHASYDSNAQLFLPLSSKSFGNQAQVNRAQLSCPIVIPQEISEDGARSWSRAYAPSLMTCGMNQPAFLSFMDSFNEFVKTSPCLDAINITSLSPVTDLDEPFQELLRNIPLASQRAKSARRDMRNNNFLDDVNATLFSQFGLFAMIITSNPSKTHHILTLDFNSIPVSSLPNTTPDMAEQSAIPESRVTSTVIHPALRLQPSIKKHSKLRKMSNFLTDYSNQQFQYFGRNDALRARMLHSSPTSHKFPGMATQDQKASPAMSLVTTVPQPLSRTGRRVDSRRLRRRRDVHSYASGSSFASESSSIYATSIISRREERDSGMVLDNDLSHDVDEEKGDPEETWSPMQPGAIYLVIVNDPDLDQRFNRNTDDRGEMDLFRHDQKGKENQVA